MKALARYISMTLLLAATPAMAGADCAAPSGGYPTFCAIPPAPTDIRTAGAFHAAVIDTRVAGRDLQNDTDASKFQLSGTDDFSREALRAATPPPPITTPGPPESAAFADDARAKASAPRRRH